MTERIPPGLVVDERLDELAYLGHPFAVSVLASALAHQLSQPLTASVTNIEAVMRLIGDSRPDVSDALRDIAAGHERLTTILRQFREQCRVTPGPRDALDVDAVVDAVGRMVQRHAASHGIRVGLTSGPGPKAISGNRVEVQQLVLHLLANACEAAEGCEEHRRDVAARTVLKDSRVLIAITDHGAGIGNADVDQLNEPVFSAKDQGTGLGLATALHIVRSHGGSLRAERHPDGGTTFTASFPAVDPNESANRLS